MRAFALQRRAPFIGLDPVWLKVERMLSLKPWGENIATQPARLAGPKLMWNRMVVACEQRPLRRPARLMRLLGGKFGLLMLAWLGLVALLAAPLAAQGFPSIKPTIVERAESPEDVTSSLELLLLLTVLSVAPGILILTTAFTRIVIVFGFLRMALSTQQLPPTQVLTGLALILTFLVMKPTIDEIRTKAIVPYLDAEITQQEAFDRSLGSLRHFMFSQVAMTDLNMFGTLAQQKPEEWKTYGDIDTFTLIPAFVTSELKRGFYMGFMLYLPFLVIDLVVATVLISMGMLVLPPVLISLPFKILLFVLVDGWTLVVTSLFKSFQVTST